MRLRILPVIVGVLLLAGAGCSRQSEPATSGDNGTKPTSPDNGSVNGEKINEGIVLTGSVTGPYSINLQWEPTTEVAESVEKWWLIGGSEENPSYPGTKFVFERSKGFREKEWKGLGAGTTHFRVCAVIKNKCATYSNDIELEIPGRVPGTK